MGQTTAIPKLVPDGFVKKLEYNANVGLVMSGDFNYVGFPALNVGVVDNGAGNPSGLLPFLTVTNNPDSREVIPDGTGGWYLVSNRDTYGNGTFNSRAQHIWYDSTDRVRIFDCITHIKADNSLDTTFRINTNTSAYKINNIQKVVLYKTTLYAWCELADQQGNTIRRKLLGIDARTGNVIWDPNTNHRLDKPTGGMIVAGRNLFMTGFINIVNGQPLNRSSLCYNLDNRQTTAWNPLNAYNFVDCSRCGPSGINSHKNRIIIKVTIPGNQFVDFYDLLSTDTVSTTLWRRQMSGAIGYMTNVAFNDTTGYYFAANYFNAGAEARIDRFRVSDGQLMGSVNYPSDAFLNSRPDTANIYIGAVKDLQLQGKYLYMYGSAQDGRTKRRAAVQLDITANYKVTDWKPFNERESGEEDNISSNRDIKALVCQGNKVFMLGDFRLLKIQYAPKLAIINPIANTLRWRARVNLQTVDYLNISAFAIDGDSLIWTTNYGRFNAFDLRTGFRVKNFAITDSYLQIDNITAASDRLYVQGNFSSLQGLAVSNGFGAISKEGAPFPFDPIFPRNTGNVNKMIVSGDRVYLGGSFTTYNGSKNLAIINRFTGEPLNWKAELPNGSTGYQYPYQVKDFIIQGNELLTTEGGIGYNTPGKYLKLSLSSGQVTTQYTYSTCQTAEQLLPKDRYIFINEQYCNPYTRESISYFDQTSNKFSNKPLISRITLPVPGNTYSQEYMPNPYSMAFAGNKLYYATRYTLDEYGTTLPVPKLMSITFPKGFFAETVEYFPRSGGNAGVVTVNFYGYNLAVGTKVKLTRNGQTPIAPADSAIKYPEAFRIETVFDLRGKVIGTWNIDITTPTGESISIPNGFTINQAKPADIQVSLNTPPAFRPGGPIRFTLSVANRGDNDAYMVPVFVTLPASVTLLTDVIICDGTQTTNSPIPQTMPTNGNGNQPASNQTTWLGIPVVGSGQVVEVPMTIQGSGNQPIPINATAGQPMMQNNPGSNNPSTKPKTEECIKALAKPIIDYLKDKLVDYAFPNDMNDCLESGLDLGLAISSRRPDNPFPLSNPPTSTVDLVGNVAQTAWKCAGKPLARRFPLLYAVGELLSDVLDDANTLGDIQDAIDKCKDLLPDPTKERPSVMIPAIFSRDPNDKLGPAGAKAERFVSGKDPFNYLIRFENYASATADAQIVRIVDTLDRDKFDFNTFQLGYFNIADTTFHISPGKKRHLVDWDMRPRRNLVLRMEARFNDTTGVLTSTYIALDPRTMELTEDVFLGFLPPNQTPPQGEGGLAYSIRLKDSVPNSATVSNTALIYFDYNAPIPTPVWNNKVDKGLPNSTMNPIAATSRSTTLTLGWRGADAESGPKLYDVFVSVNGGAYKTLLSATQDSTFQFVGKADSTYRFYSVAYDHVYNQEPIPAVHDIITTIRNSTIESVRAGNWTDTATWNCGCIPETTDVVSIGHLVTIPANTTAHINKIIYRNAGRLQFNGQAKLLFMR